MSIPISGTEPAYQRHIVRGSAWLIGVRWSLRLTGLASTLVLARLLTPEDFGIVAIAALIVGAIEIFSQTGQYNAIVRHPDPTREHYNSVWTVGLLLGLGLGLLAWALTPLTTAYFHEPRAKLVVETLALRPAILGFQNVGIVNFQRQLNFQRQFWFSVLPKLVSLFLTVGFAFVLRNYWALVIGIVGQSLAAVVLSYIMSPYRPRLGFSKIREIWSFSIWSLLRSLGTYANDQIDKLAVAGFAGAAGMGRYDVARDIAISPSQELITPVVSTLIPVMAKVQNDKEKRRDLYLTTLSWSALICTSTGVGVTLVAEDMCDFVLGPKWHSVWPLMPWFALTWAIVGMTSGVSSVLLALGHAYISARLQWVRVGCFALAVFPVAYLFRDLEAVIMTRFFVTLVLSPGIFYVLARVMAVPLRDFANAMCRPVAASFVMAMVVLALNTELTFSGPSRLFIDIAIGATAYGATLMAIWMASGRPPGLERTAWEFGLGRIAAR